MRQVLAVALTLLSSCVFAKAESVESYLLKYLHVINDEGTSKVGPVQFRDLARACNVTLRGSTEFMRLGNDHVVLHCYSPDKGKKVRISYLIEEIEVDGELELLVLSAHFSKTERSLKGDALMNYLSVAVDSLPPRR